VVVNIAFMVMVMMHVMVTVIKVVIWGNTDGNLWCLWWWHC